jgi:hypothetical protein
MFRIEEHFTLKTEAAYFSAMLVKRDLFCGLVVRVPGYRFRGLGSIPSTTTFSEKQRI